MNGNMTIRDADYFVYAGVSSIDFGIRNVNISSGMLEESFAAPRSIREVSIAGRDRPYFQNIAKEPLRFQVSCAFEETWNPDRIREAARWLTEQSYYRELVFSSDPERVFYALVIDEPMLIHNGLSEGYINVTFKCDSPYSYSPVYYSPRYEWKETVAEIAEQDFAEGSREALILGPQGELRLDSCRPRWSDYASGTRWSDIG